jgi:hypothetical protein
MAPMTPAADQSWVSSRSESGLSRLASANGRVRSTEEKKAILGDMMGNVDQLVEGVRKAGIWGLV